MGCGSSQPAPQPHQRQVISPERQVTPSEVKVHQNNQTRPDENRIAGDNVDKEDKGEDGVNDSDSSSRHNTDSETQTANGRHDLDRPDGDLEIDNMPKSTQNDPSGPAVVKEIDAQIKAEMQAEDKQDAALPPEAAASEAGQAAGDSVTIATNALTNSMQLPESSQPSLPVDYACIRGYCKSKWPIRCYSQLDWPLSANAGHGGCAALMQVSNAYGAEGSNTTSELLLLRCGLDGNHFSCVSLGKNHAGHFGASNSLVTGEDGTLYPDCLFGSNHISVISTDPRHGNSTHGVIAEAGSAEGEVVLPLDANGGREDHGGGSSLLLCGGWETGVDEAKFVSGTYMLRSGWKDNHAQSLLLKGSDKWTFSVRNDGRVLASGPPRSVIGLYHNRDNLQKDMGQVKGPAKVSHTQAANGADGAVLLKQCSTVNSCTLLVICSHSTGAEDATGAAAYMLSIQDGQVTFDLINGISGVAYSLEKADCWMFKLENDSLLVHGPQGPCRYLLLSNIANGNAHDIIPCCLATGEKEPIRGAVSITERSVIGWVSSPLDILIKVDEKTAYVFKAASLCQRQKGKHGFCRQWSANELSDGIRLVRVYALGKSLKDDSGRPIELEGSPVQIEFQRPGVVYAVNCAGPAYQAQNGIIYTSEFKQFANFDPDYIFGTRSKACGGVKTEARLPHILQATDDGPLYVTTRTSNTESTDEQNAGYEVSGLPSGKFTLRLHTFNGCPESLTWNGTNLTSQVASQAKIQKQLHSACSVDIPVSVAEGKATLKFKGFVCGFALLDATYQEKQQSAAEKQQELKEKQQLSDQVEPLARTMTRKERKIVGWSANLLQNASGEAGDMSHWNVSGSWQVHEPGYGTEKTFNTSHMECHKYQEVDLTEHFSADYLDTAPEIQVSEWYREGVCGGGYYSFEASIMTQDGKVMDKYSSGEIGKIYRDNKWEQELATFQNYGPGMRRVAMQSMGSRVAAGGGALVNMGQIQGKDDKHWGGQYGALMSNAVIRIRRESKAASNDAFVDVIQGTDGGQQVRTKRREKLVAKVLADNDDLLQELLEEQVLTEVDPVFRKQTITGQRSKVKPRKRKKREIRVFVSSTFRDFKEEREQLIKKTFREINGVCSDRGVFFTYVDLRWGITEEQTNHGQTIAICLQEIDRCRPYFICMMGERFGWSQKDAEVDKKLNESFDYAIQNFPKLAWVEQNRFGSSVTELEILHGVMNDIEARKQRSFFYIRDPISPDGLTENELSVFRPESDWHRDKQYGLRDSIQATPGLTVRQYNSTDTVCQQIKQDLEWCVEEDFPKGTELTPLERERDAHLAFAEARRRVYIGGGDYFRKIDSFLSETATQPLVILGESGSGKSALVANWVGRQEEKELEVFVFVHFIGSSAESASYVKLLRRLFEEMKSTFSFEHAVPTSDSNLVRDLPLWLNMAGSQAHCIIMLDALNQLDDGSGTEGSEQDLLWIPRELPPGVHMLLSTLPGRAHEAAKSAGWPTLEVTPLQASQKAQIVTEYMEGIYGKTLSDDQKEIIVAAPQTHNPLYLKALLDEVRLYGSFRTLTEKIQEYLSASNPGDLFAKILERLEDDFEKGQHQRPDLVKQTTTAIWCSHRGMTEAELLDLLQLPSAIWSPFYLSLVENLVNRNGIVNFFHDHLRQAVESRYLPTPEDKQRGYQWLAEFFDQRLLDDRKVDELPFLLTKSREMDKLRDVVTDLDIFSRMVATEDGKFELIKAWQLLGDYSEVELAYTEALQRLPADQRHSHKHAKLNQDLAEFFMDLGLYGAARTMMESLLHQLEEEYGDSHGAIVYSAFDQSRVFRCRHSAVLDLLHNLGTVCQKQKELQKAKSYFEEAISRQQRVRSPGSKLQLTEGLLGQATVLFMLEDMSEAKKYLMRARELATNVLGSRHHYVAAIINKLGQLSYKQGRLEEALGFYLQDLGLTRGEVGTGHPRVAGILNDIALVYDDRNDPVAGELYEAALLVLLDMYGNNHLEVAVVRYNLGAFYFATNSFAKAKFQFTEAVKIYEAFLGSEHLDTIEASKALVDVTVFTLV